MLLCHRHRQTIADSQHSHQQDNRICDLINTSGWKILLIKCHQSHSMASHSIIIAIVNTTYQHLFIFYAQLLSHAIHFRNKPIGMGVENIIYNFNILPIYINRIPFTDRHKYGSEVVQLANKVINIIVHSISS